jgi:hypothetical protein
MIKGYTIFYHMQREPDAEGYLLADESDFGCAKKLFDSQLESSVTKLTDRESKILQYIGDNFHCTISQIALGIGIPESSVRTAIHGRKDRKDGGLLNKVEGLTVSKETNSYTKEEGGFVSKTENFYNYLDLGDFDYLLKTGFATLGGDTP